uniref:Uncharacterized protein n=1 Tax=Anguilla anguilla TaxID=7936 RepID=A0A0E9S541_ANGAN
MGKNKNNDHFQTKKKTFQYNTSTLNASSELLVLICGRIMAKKNLDPHIQDKKGHGKKSKHRRTLEEKGGSTFLGSPKTQQPFIMFEAKQKTNIYATI